MLIIEVSINDIEKSPDQRWVYLPTPYIRVYSVSYPFNLLKGHMYDNNCFPHVYIWGEGGFLRSKTLILFYTTKVDTVW